MSKYLILLVLLTGCASDVHETTPSELKYKAGDICQIKTPFYSKCDAIINSHSKSTKDGDVPYYFVKIDCQHVPDFMEWISQDKLTECN